MFKSDPVKLELFRNLFSSIAEEMGVTLQRSAFSPNIKERRDFSCAIFDRNGRMVEQAAHIPVHLGSMPLSVETALRAIGEFRPGDIVILNDPFSGGTHLPDITLISPVFVDDELLFFTANRAHHSDVGGISPGSMSLSTDVIQEGIRIPPIKLAKEGVLDEEVLSLILANVRTPEEREGDLRAQVAANEIGRRRILEIIGRYGPQEVSLYSSALLDYAERMMRSVIRNIPDGTYSFTDYLDDDGVTDAPVKIHVQLTVEDDEATVDFSGSSPQVRGSVNAVYAITLSAVFYVFRALAGFDMPSNSGCLAPIKVIAPEGTVLNAQSPAAVAGGNVETSQRIVDALFGALLQACPERVPAASCGSMNNLAIGGYDPFRRRAFAYYETIAGGMGARPDKDGLSAVHTHMTNTMNTPIEAIEHAYPLRVHRYEIRRGSGGNGRFKGGDGLIREIEILCEAEVSILSDRRRFPPYGALRGQPGKQGKNTLIRNGRRIPLRSKVNLKVKPNDVIRIETPGGGGYGGSD
jgi:N-methylhydantoinase B/oxoprolinase/acetone carboxylase alpha subunit